MKYDVVTIGGATEDMAIHTDEGVLIDNKTDILRQKLIAFEYGAKLKVSSAVSTFGGGAANTAVCLARLGLKVASLLAIGDDERGVRIKNNLKQEKVDVKLVQTLTQESSGFSPMIICRDNEHVVFSIRGANNKLKLTEAILDQIRLAEWFYLSSLSGDTKDWLQILRKIFSIKSVKIVWNPGHLQLDQGRWVLDRFLKKTYLLILNLDEARELIISDPQYAKKGQEFFNDVESLIRLLKSWGPQIVVITEGKKGARAMLDGQIYQVTGSLKAKPVNTVGVGDAFGASLIAGLIYFKGDLAKAMKLGKLNTASVVLHNGAQTGLIYKKDILKF